MSRILGVAIAVGVLLVAAHMYAAEATTSSAPQPLRIGFVDLPRITEDSQWVKTRMSTVQKNLVEKEKSLKDKRDEYKRLSQELVQQESVLTAAQIEQRKEQLRRLRDEIDRLEYEKDRVLSTTNRDLVPEVFDEILGAVERVAARYKFDLIFQNEAVLYASERVDLTNTVIRELDIKMSAPKPGVSPASTPARRSSENEKKLPTPKSGADGSVLRKAPKVEEGSPRRE